MEIDAAEVKKAISFLKGEGELFEVRYIGEGKFNSSAYFTDPDTCIKVLSKFSPRKKGNVYITLNRINPACYSRSQRDMFVDNASPTTADGDILRYSWLMIDIDPIRTSGTSSSNDELSHAEQIANTIYDFNMQRNWSLPIVAHSGNGVHLLYKLDLMVTPETKAVVEKVLKAFDFLFSDDQAEVDKTTFNPARICKLYGTWAKKGSDSAERPHRLSKIVMGSPNVEPVTFEQLQAVADLLPDDDEKTTDSKKSYNSTPSDFDLEAWFSDHFIGIYSQKPYSGGTLYTLDSCPFHPEHGHDAKVYKKANGQLCFICHHNSCADKSWHDFRLHFEPDAYDKKQQKRGVGRPRKKEDQEPEEEIIDFSGIKPRSAADIDFSKTPQSTFFVEDILTNGVYTLNGFSKVGKSRLLLQMLIDIANGDKFLGKFATKKCDVLYLAFEDLTEDYENRLRKFLDGEPQPANLYTLTKSDYEPVGFITPRLGPNGGLQDLIDRHMEEHPDTGVIGIDVLSIIRSKRQSIDPTEDERRDINMLLSIAAKYNIAILIAHHISKAGLRDSSKTGSAIGSGAGTYAVSGTLIGEMMLLKDTDNQNYAIFTAGGRRSAQRKLYLEDNFPAWDYVSDYGDEMQRRQDIENAAMRNAFIETAKHLVKKYGTWQGTATQFYEENCTAAHLPLMDEKPNRNIWQKYTQDLKAAGIIGTISPNGTGSPRYRLSAAPKSVEYDTQTHFEDIPF